MAHAVERLEPRMMLAAGIGLQAAYFDSPDLANPVVVQVDATVDFDWATGSPQPSIDNDHFSVRWTGQVEASHSETYSFIINANDGVRLWINGQLLIDQFKAGELIDVSGDIGLIAGRKYDLQLEYLEVTGNASIRLEWSSPTQSREVIPASQLFPAQRGTIDAQRWEGISGSSVSDLTSDPNFPNTPSAISTLDLFELTPDVGDNYGQRVAGFLHAPTTGPYTFLVAADESAELWLANTRDPADKQLIASVQTATLSRQWDADPGQRSGVVYLNAGQSYYIEALHKESTGADHLAVGWIRPGSLDIQVIEGEFLSAVMPSVRIFANQPNVSEISTTPASFTVVRQGGPTLLPLDIDYVITGEAINGIDFEALSGTVTIPANQVSTELTLVPLTDGLDEGNESFVIELIAGQGYQVGLPGQRTAYGNLQDDAVAPTGGSSLWDGQQLSNFSRFGGTFTTESDPEYGDVIQAVIDGSQANPWNSQLRQNIDAPVSAGDILFVEFRMRSIGAEGNLAAIFERAGTPYTKSLAQGIPVGTDWSKIQLAFYAAESYAAGEASFGFHLGYGAQTLQFTDFLVLNYGPPQSLAPETAFGLNNISGTHGTAQTVNVTGQPFEIAYQVDVNNVPHQVWHIQAVERNEGVVANGDTMRFEFSVRAIAGTMPQTSFVVQRTDTYATLYSQSIDLTSEWQPFTIEFDSNDEFGLNGLQAVFNLGYEIQTVEIGGFHWKNLENSVDITELPRQFPAASYEGRNGVDDWRSAADQRIENDRKSKVTINVTDLNGQPLEGAVVSIRQAKHEFLFGSAISAYGGKLDPNGNDQALKYQSEIKRLFNTVVLENALKWPGWLNDPGRAIQGVDFATSNDLYVRGHNLIWPSRTFMPDSIWDEYDSRVANDGEVSAKDWLKTTIAAHFDEMLTTFDGQIPEWDVVNEPYTNHDVMDLLGDSIVIDWFQQVRDFDPDIKLTLNDFFIFARNGGDVNHRANFEYWLGLLNDAGLLDVIGEQSHYTDASLTDIEVLGQLINTYHTQFNAPIAITEFDVDSADEQLQADYLRDYMTMSFSQSAITEFLHWGFWQDSHWLPDAALYRSDFSIKPNGQAYEDLVFGQWWSDVQGTTRDGSVSANVFRGDYDVVVQYGNQTYSGTVTVDDSGTSGLTINVPQDPSNSDPLIDADQAIVSGKVAAELTNTGRWFEPDGQAVTLSASVGDVTKNQDGSWSWTFSPEQAYANLQVTVTATDSLGGSSETTFTLVARTNVSNRGISFGGSAFGEHVLATNKSALLPGQPATVDNFTNYFRGINRLVVEIAGLADTDLSTDDFEFRVGNTETPGEWMMLDGTGEIPLPTISVSPASQPGVHRILLAWPDSKIVNNWLQVTVKSTVKTGLPTDDVFYFGNQIGDVNGDVNSSSKILVNSQDTLLVRANRTIGTTVGIENLYDVNRNGTVNSQDTLIVRANRVIAGGLLMFTPPGAGFANLATASPNGEGQVPGAGNDAGFVTGLAAGLDRLFSRGSFWEDELTLPGKDEPVTGPRIAPKQADLPTLLAGAEELEQPTQPSRESSGLVEKQDLMQLTLQESFRDALFDGPW